jgi:hypothetical protein
MPVEIVAVATVWTAVGAGCGIVGTGCGGIGGIGGSPGGAGSCGNTLTPEPQPSNSDRGKAMIVPSPLRRTLREQEE